jgi:hypothetical protein
VGGYLILMLIILSIVTDGELYGYESILGLFLESQLVAMTAFSLSAVGGLEGKSGVALTADLLVAVVFLGNGSDGGIHHTSSKPEDEVKG